MSPLFLLFVSITLLFFHFFPQHQNRTLLLAGVIFLASWDWKSLALLAILSQIVYFALKQKSFRPGHFRTTALIALLMTPLLYCKFSQSDLIIPLGLSYYVFQLSGYVFDCYRGEVTTPFSWLRFTLFSSFFPQLAMGPIERFGTMRDQFRDPVSFDWLRFLQGLFRITLGVLKKLTLADPLFPVLRLAFPQENIEWSGGQILFFCFIGLLQIYFDFSAYSDIAIGLGRLFNVRLTENFRQPYLASSIADIWQRWHFSLVRWVRSYIYLPLYLRTRSVFWCTLITFLVVGFWHRFTINFFLWGIYWFALFYLEYFLKSRWPKAQSPPWLGRLIAISAMALSTVFFLGNSASQIGSTFLKIATPATFFPFLPHLNLGISRWDWIGLLTCFAIVIGQDYLAQNERLQNWRSVATILIASIATNVFLSTLFAKDLPLPFIYLMF